MALLSRIKCERCEETADVMHSPSDAKPKICERCRVKEATTVRDQYLADLAALPLEERLRRIEAWIYDYRPQWVPPPRF
jgi:hypothetical protein